MQKEIQQQRRCILMSEKQPADNFWPRQSCRRNWVLFKYRIVMLRAYPSSTIAQ